MKYSSLILLPIFILVNAVIFGEGKGGKGGGGGGGSAASSGGASSGSSGNQYEDSVGTAWRKSSSDKFFYTNGTGTGSRAMAREIKEYLASDDAGYIYFPDQTYRGYIYAAGAAMEYNDIKYFWGTRYYREDSDSYMCSFPIEDNDEVLGWLEFRTGGFPTEIVYGCDLDHTCCGLECCNPPSSISKGWIVFICLVILALIVMLGCLVMKLFLMYGLTCVCCDPYVEQSLPSSEKSSSWRVDAINADITAEPTKVEPTEIN